MGLKRKIVRREMTIQEKKAFVLQSLIASLSRTGRILDELSDISALPIDELVVYSDGATDIRALVDSLQRIVHNDRADMPY